MSTTKKNGAKKKRERTKKSTKGEMERRIDEIMEKVLYGATRTEILQFASISGWKLTDRQVDTYIKSAWERIQETNEPNRMQNIGRAIKRLDNLIWRAIEKKDLHAEAKAIALQSKIMGIDQYLPQDNSEKPLEEQTTTLMEEYEQLGTTH